MRLLNTIAAGVIALGAGSVWAQTTSTATLGTVRLTQTVKADGQALPAGTYQVRLSTASVTPVVGQGPEAERWVEFVKGGTVAGRELASVVSAEDMRTMAKMPRKTAAVRVEPLKGGDYLRVWLVHGGNHYLINLPTGGK